MRLFVLVLLVSGCAHTQPVSLASPEGRAEINSLASRRPATLTVRASPRRPARSLHVGPDQTTWVDRLSGAPGSAPTADVVSVSFRRGNMWRAAAIGAGAGAALGTLAALGDDGGGWIRFSPAFYIGTGLVEGSVIGAAVGAFQTARYDAEGDEQTDGASEIRDAPTAGGAADAGRSLP